MNAKPQWRLVKRYTGEVVATGSHREMMRLFRDGVREATKRENPRKYTLTVWETSHWVVRTDERFTDYATIGGSHRWNPGSPFPVGAR